MRLHVPTPRVLAATLLAAAAVAAAPHAARAQTICTTSTPQAFTADATLTVTGSASQRYDVRVTAVGAAGAGNGYSSGGARGGAGATMVATFRLSGGTGLRVLVGQGATSFSNGSASGGGGTAVVANAATLLLLAGGGGGAGDGSGTTGRGKGGLISTAGPGGGGSSGVGSGGGGGGFGAGADGAPGEVSFFGSAPGGRAGTLTATGAGGGSGGRGVGGGGSSGDMGGGGGGGYRGGAGGFGGGFAGGQGGTSFVETGEFRGTFDAGASSSGADGGAASGSGSAGSVTVACTAAPNAPEILVRGGGVLIPSGDASPSPTDGTDFGTLATGTTFTERTFTVENAGTQPLTLSAITFSGPNAGEFSLRTSPASPVAADGSTTFTVRLTPAGAGLRTATLSLPNNTPGASPYTFALQGRGGIVVPPTAQVYWVDRDAAVIRRANRDGSGVSDVVTGLTSPQGMAVDAVNRRVYWTDSVVDQIFAANLDGTDVAAVVTSGLSGPQDIEVDPAGGYIYWVDRLFGVVKRASLTGTNQTTLVSGLNSPEGLTLDLTGGYIYFVEGGAGTLRRVNLDGTGPVTLVSGLNVPIGVAVDRAGGKVYWTESGAGLLRSANLDGSGVATVLSGLSSPEGLAVDAAEGRLYLSDTGRDLIERMTLTGGSRTTLVTGQPYAADLQLTEAPALPVELTAFTARTDGAGRVRLVWTTASETNNAGFEVQQADGAVWTVLAFVPGAGTTGEAHAYGHTVEGLTPGAHRFRLRQVDLDGASEPSPIVEVAVGMDGAAQMSRVWPSPVSGAEANVTVAVRVAQPVRVAVYDLLGREVALAWTGEMAAGQSQRISIPVGDLSAGVYVVRMSGTSFVRSERLVVAR